MRQLHIHVSLSFSLPSPLSKINNRSSTTGQDGGVGRYNSPPHTTKRRTTTTNLKTQNNQNCQKIKLYGSPTTKELKKKHSFRLAEGADMGRQGREDTQQGGGWRTRLSHICVKINQEGQLGSKTDRTTQGSSAGK